MNNIKNNRNIINNYRTKREEQFFSNLENTVKSFDMIISGDSILVGVSGGADSVALLYFLMELYKKNKIKIGIAHFNHDLRGHESENDANFVKKLADKLNLPFYLEKKNVYQYKKDNKLSLEEAARDLRYDFFKRVAFVNGYNKVALGHHADDNAELILMNLLRGSGSLGVAGIPEIRDQLFIRPLINTSKDQIIQYLSYNNIEYVNDKSNDDYKFLRNRIRGELLPLLKKNYNPNIVAAINRFASIIKSEEEWMDSIAVSMFKKVLHSLDDRNVYLDIDMMESIHPACLRRILRLSVKKIKGDLRKITFYHIDSIIQSLQKQRKNNLFFDLPDQIRVTIEDNFLIFSKKEKKLRLLESDLENKKKISFEYNIFKKDIINNSGLIYIKELNLSMKYSLIKDFNIDNIYKTKNSLAFLDMDLLDFPLKLRNIKNGDRFKPLGMNGSQKIKKFFINNKISRSQRVITPVLLSKERIVWLVGFRIDNSFKVKDSSKNILKFEVLN